MEVRSCLLFASLFTAVACTSVRGGAVADVPALEEYCRVAQRVVTRTDRPVNLIVRESFDAFVKSKAIIPDGDAAIPEIQQFNWAGPDGSVVGISCKLKSADHLNLVYGEGTAGPDGACQDMNRYVLASLRIAPDDYRYERVVFDPTEQPQTRGVPPVEGGAGPQWLQPYVAIEMDADNALVVKTKGFRVDFLDPRFEQAPARFRGVHYCHFVAPDHLRAVVTGAAAPGVMIGREVDLSKYSATPTT
jgi:hypothetical protein